MATRTPNAVLRKTLYAVSLAALCIALAIESNAQQSKAPVQKGFATPEQAAQALIEAAGTYNVPALTRVLGPHSKDLIESEDPVRDKNRAEEFAELARRKQTVRVSLKTPARAEVVVGEDNWPLPIPLVKRNGLWYFDTAAGRKQILFRRVGENEMDAIAVLRGFVEAQNQYASEPHDGVTQYAQRIISTPGTQDGLAWKNADGTWGGPVGETIAKAIEEGYTAAKQPYHGYYFKVLKGQGPAAPMGQMDYVVEGVMIGGFALAAAPADYRVTGVKSFLVSNDGVVYQKDLGPDTLAIFQNMTRFNPDDSWQPTNDGKDYDTEH